MQFKRGHKTEKQVSVSSAERCCWFGRGGYVRTEERNTAVWSILQIYSTGPVGFGELQTSRSPLGITDGKKRGGEAIGFSQFLSVWYSSVSSSWQFPCSRPESD